MLTTNLTNLTKKTVSRQHSILTVVWDYFPIDRVCACWYNSSVTVEIDGPAAVLQPGHRHYQIDLRDASRLSIGSPHSKIRK